MINNLCLDLMEINSFEQLHLDIDTGHEGCLGKIWVWSNMDGWLSMIVREVYRQEHFNQRSYSIYNVLDTHKSMFGDETMIIMGREIEAKLIKTQNMYLFITFDANSYNIILSRGWPWQKSFNLFLSLHSLSAYANPLILLRAGSRKTLHVT